MEAGVEESSTPITNPTPALSEVHTLQSNACRLSSSIVHRSLTRLSLKILSKVALVRSACSSEVSEEDVIPQLQLHPSLPASISYSASSSSSSSNNGSNNDSINSSSSNGSCDIIVGNVGGNDIAKSNTNAASDLRQRLLLQRNRKRPYGDLGPVGSEARAFAITEKKKDETDPENNLNEKEVETEVMEQVMAVVSVKQRSAHSLDNVIAFENKLLVVPPPRPSDVTVSFLGTGSATPSKHRNNSCIIISIPILDPIEEFTSQFESVPTNGRSRRNIVLLDSGEGTSVQLYQSVGGDLARFDEALLSIRLVWISHHHADHICGLPLLLEQVNRAAVVRRQTAKHATQPFQKLIVIAPPAVIAYYEYSACVAGLDDLVTFVPSIATLYASYSIPLSPSLSLHLYEKGPTQLLRVRSVQVPHCRDSYGAVLDIQTEGTCALKIVYSGDCRPSLAMINAGMNCDLLLHEATFDDSMQSDAECKRHCTTSEAVTVGVRMRAKHIVLTHFSQRYPTTVQSFHTTLPQKSAQRYKIPSTVDKRSGNNGHEINVAGVPYSVAFDLLHFSFPSQIHNLPVITSILANALALASAAAKEGAE